MVKVVKFGVWSKLKKLLFNDSKLTFFMLQIKWKVLHLTSIYSLTHWSVRIMLLYPILACPRAQPCFIYSTLVQLCRPPYRTTDSYVGQSEDCFAPKTFLQRATACSEKETFEFFCYSLTTFFCIRSYL